MARIDFQKHTRVWISEKSINPPIRVTKNKLSELMENLKDSSYSVGRTTNFKDKQWWSHTV